MKDLYLILQVTPTATPEQIHSAYRRRALELHPDKSGADSEPFLELQKAYSVLSDPAQRAAYDRQIESDPIRRRRTPRRRAAESFRQTAPLSDLREIWLARSLEDVEPSFEDVFDRLLGNLGFLTPLGTEMLHGLTVEVFLSHDEALKGGTVRILVPAHTQCRRCQGHGRIGRSECWRCQRSGLITIECPVDVAFPPQLRQQCIVQVRLDRFGLRNLLLTVRFRPEPHAPHSF